MIPVFDGSETTEEELAEEVAPDPKLAAAIMAGAERLRLGLSKHQPHNTGTDQKVHGSRGGGAGSTEDWVGGAWDRHKAKGSDVHQALIGYQGTMYDTVNRAFRHPGANFEIGSLEEANKIIDGMEKAYEEAPEDLTLFRGSGGPMSWFVEGGEQYDGRYVSSGFVSTSVLVAVAQEFGETYTIKVPKGSPVIPMDMSEGEVILPHHSVFHRTGRRQLTWAGTMTEEEFWDWEDAIGS